MSMRFLVIAALMCFATCFSGSVLADDTALNDGNTVTFTGTGSSFTYGEEHNELAPFKGFATVTVFNDSDEFWSDFHFKVFKSNPTSNITHTIFVEGSDGSGGSWNPTSSQDGLTWTISNDPLGSEIELRFTEWVAPDTTASFKVWTDNTEDRTKFGMMVWPTDDYVPEPSSLLALSGSLLGLVGFAWRKRL